MKFFMLREACKSREMGDSNRSPGPGRREPYGVEAQDAPKGAEAGRRERTGGPRPEAESPLLRKTIESMKFFMLREACKSREMGDSNRSPVPRKAGALRG
jgi:hypothetical protein